MDNIENKPKAYLIKNEEFEKILFKNLLSFLKNVI